MAATGPPRVGLIPGPGRTVYAPTGSASSKMRRVKTVTIAPARTDRSLNRGK